MLYAAVCQCRMTTFHHHLLLLEVPSGNLQSLMTCVTTHDLYVMTCIVYSRDTVDEVKQSLGQPVGDGSWQQRDQHGPDPDIVSAQRQCNLLVGRVVHLRLKLHPSHSGHSAAGEALAPHCQQAGIAHADADAIDWGERAGHLCASSDSRGAGG